MSDLDSSAVKKLKVSELRSELTKRGLDAKGLKQILVDRLLASVENDDEPVEMATEEKEVEQDDAVEEPEKEEMITDNGQEESSTSITEVTSQPPSELMVEDSVEQGEPEDEKVEEDKDQVVKSDVKEDEKTADDEAKEKEVATEAPEAKVEEKQETSGKKATETPSEQVPVVEEEKDETQDSSVVLSRYISDLYFKISPDGLSGKVIDNEGFSYLWGGAKTTWGVNKGKVCFECKVLKNIPNELPDSENPKIGARVGWSIEEASLQLGEDSLSYGYDSSGKSCTASNFSDYGVTFTEGDVIGCYLDLESEAKTVSYTKNDEDLGVAFTLTEEELENKVFFPHILLKNTECQINAGAQEEPWFPSKEGFTLIEKVGNENLVEGNRGYKEKDECEVIMMIGLPASGKTTWLKNYIDENKCKKYNIIGTNTIMEKMKLNGEERKRNSDDFDKLMDKATKCLKRLFEVAPTKKRNYILDQTNVHPSAQKKKMEGFVGFKSTAVIVIPKPEELEKRAKQKKEKEGFEIPDYALLDMKANFSLPKPGSLFAEVKYVEESEEESGKVVSEYKRNAKASQSRGQSSYKPRRDDKSSGRFHPYKRDNYDHNRSHSGGRDFQHGGSRGGSMNYGRQHGGSSHDRNRGGGGYNKGHYQNYSRGSGGARGVSGGSRGGYQKNNQQQRYSGAYAVGQYNFAQQQRLYGTFPNPYQQARTAYGAAAFPQQHYYSPQQTYYQQQGGYSQYGRPGGRY